MGYIKELTNAVVTEMKKQIAEADEEYEQEKAKQKEQLPKPVSKSTPAKPATVKSPLPTPEQAVQKEINLNLHLLEIAKYFCEALPSIPNYIALDRDISPENLLIETNQNGKVIVTLYARSANAIFREEDLHTVFRVLNRSLRSIQLKKLNEYNALMRDYENEITKLNQEVNYPMSPRYGNYIYYGTQYMQIQNYYIERKKEYFIYQRTLQICDIHKAPNALKIGLYFLS